MDGDLMKGLFLFAVLAGTLYLTILICGWGVAIANLVFAALVSAMWPFK